MQPTIQLDTRGFNAVLQEYQRSNRRTWPEICNAKALDVNFRALKETPKADKESIRALESKPWWPRYIRKRLKGKTVDNKRNRKSSKLGHGATGSFAAEYSRKVIAARLRSVAFLKAGWLPGIRRLSMIVKDRFGAATIGGAKQYGVEKGAAIPAVSGDNPTATIINSAIGIDKMGVDALQRAVDGAAADMGEYIARKLEGNARKVAH
jgi:hypothetical protein